jgi:hypothetical protein
VPIRRVQQLPVPEADRSATFGLMAERLRFETNDAGLLELAAASFGRFPVPPDDGREPLVVRLLVEDAPGRPRRPFRPSEDGHALPTATDDEPPRATAYVSRVQGDLLTISGGVGDQAVLEVDRGIATGVVRPATAAAHDLVRTVFIDAMALSLLGRARGYVTVHAAAVVRHDVAVVLHGPAGAGKSTLAIACARRGFGVVAEDAVFVRRTSSGLELWGLPWTQRLLPDAPRFFPELADLVARPQPNGETKVQVDLDAAYPGRAVPCARAGPVLLVTRGPGPTRLEAVPAGDADLELLWPFDGGWTPAHEATAAGLLAGGCFRLHVGGTPDEAVDLLDDWLARRSVAVAAAER